MKAFLKNYRQSPRKVRLVADAVRGKKVDAVMVELQFMPKRASRAISKLIASAKANAENNFKVTEALYIKEITVDDGPTYKLHRPVSRGRAHPIRKRTSHVNVALGLLADKPASARNRSAQAVADGKKKAKKEDKVNTEGGESDLGQKAPVVKKITAKKSANKDNA